MLTVGKHLCQGEVVGAVGVGGAGGAEQLLQDYIESRG